VINLSTAIVNSRVEELSAPSKPADTLLEEKVKTNQPTNRQTNQDKQTNKQTNGQTDR